MGILDLGKFKNRPLEPTIFIRSERNLPLHESLQCAISRIGPAQGFGLRVNAMLRKARALLFIHRKFRGLPAFESPQNILTSQQRLCRLMFQNQACPQYYVHKRYALPCQIRFGGIEL
jgi:hypothetical protein